MNEMNQTTQAAQSRVPPSAILIILVAMALSLAALVFSVTIPDAYGDAKWLLLLLGFLGVGISLLELLRLRRRLERLRIVIPPVTTTIECKKCGFKSVREYQRGDYIFKEGDNCQKCNEKMLITAIYREVKDKEKHKTPI